MNIHTTYYGIQRVTYTFSESEIKAALLAVAKIEPLRPGRRIEFELCDHGAEIRVIHQEEPAPIPWPPSGIAPTKINTPG